MTGIDGRNTELSIDARLFVERAARSVSEIQQSVSNVADVVVFLEVLGYTDSSVSRYGFADLQEFAMYVFELVDFYDPKESVTFADQYMVKIKSAKRRFLEALALTFPVIGMLALLFIFGVSLWMARVLPEVMTTAFMSGVFLGMLCSEGSLQGFGRLFTFYFTQGNIGEAKRILRHNYQVFFTLLIATTITVIGVGFLARIPPLLVAITVITSVSIGIHRSSYMLIFSLRKLAQMIGAYAAAMTVLVLVYTYAPSSVIEVLLPVSSSTLVTGTTVRYFLALGAAFMVLSIPAVYYHRKTMNMKATTSEAGAPHFYSPLSIGDMTLTSRFGVQLWETVPYFLFGTFTFMMIFADRIVSWIFNPLVTVYGSVLPLEFNSAYHAGADPALIILLVTTIAAYVILAPLYDSLNNLSARIKAYEAGTIERFLQRTYRRLLILSLIISALFALALNLVAPEIIHYLGGGPASLEILRVASIADVFFSAFLVNGMFLAIVNRIKIAVVISAICTFIVVAEGVFLAQLGFQYIIWGYLTASIIGMFSSTLYCNGIKSKFAALFLGRYV